MEQPKSINVPVKIAVAAIGILLVDAVILIAFGERDWKGLPTLLIAAELTSLSALFWPLVETGGYAMLLGIDYARQAIWRKRQQELEKARKEGYKQGYEARLAEENGHDDERNRRTEGST
jgi:hypothetical protein